MRRLRIVLLALLAATLLVPAVRQPAPGQTLVRPNIVVILTDDQTVESVTSATMPYTKGRADWVRFSNAILNVVLPIKGDHPDRPLLPPHRHRS
jgi:hypothetical protein